MSDALTGVTAVMSSSAVAYTNTLLSPSSSLSTSASTASTIGTSTGGTATTTMDAGTGLNLNTNGTGNGPNIGLIAGIAAGGVVVIVGVLLLAVKLVKGKDGSKGARLERDANSAASRSVGAVRPPGTGRVAGPQGLMEEPNVAYNGPPIIATNQHSPSSEDEIALFPGNFVDLKRLFRDGWGVGQNLDTGAYGVFPLDCLRLADYLPSSPSGSGSIRFESRHSNVTSQVLSERKEYVAESLRARTLYGDGGSGGLGYGSGGSGRSVGGESAQWRQ
ncbi:hypothetical protein HDU93_005726 [Gonapodya sp. JEL0774]|nr:hypothetical protein HDU93_005726 [Gonapodya sp. JEL0774]